MSEIKLSVIMPAYNAEKTIKKAIESVLISQSNNFELIVINDGSSDSTEELVKSIADPRIKYIKKNNSGVSDTRNHGLKKAVGEYVTFIDSDDCYTNGGVDRILDFIEEKPFDLLVFGFYKEYIKNTRVFKTEANSVSGAYSFEAKDGSEYFRYLFESSHILFQTSWNKVFKREIMIKNNVEFNTELVCYENLTMILDYLKYAEKIIFTNDILYKYNIFADKDVDVLNKRNKLDLTSDVSACYKMNLELCEKYNYPKDYRNFMDAAFLEEFIFCSRKYFEKSDRFTKKQQSEAFRTFLYDDGFLKLRENYLRYMNFYNILYKLNDSGLKRLAYKLYEKKLIKR